MHKIVCHAAQIESQNLANVIFKTFVLISERFTQDPKCEALFSTEKSAGLGRQQSADQSQLAADNARANIFCAHMNWYLLESVIVLK